MRRALVASVAVVALTSCASISASGVHAGDRRAWKVYRAEVSPDLRRVLGLTYGLRSSCARMLGAAPAPRFGIDVGPTLRACAAGDLSNARMLAHIQIDQIATNDRSLGLLP